MLTRIAIGLVVATAATGCGPSGDRAAQGPARETPSDTGAGEARAVGTSAPVAATRPTDVAAGPGMPAGWETAPTGTYSAKQAGGTVTITAKGENPTPGYETKLMQSMLRIWPPQYVLVRKKPPGVVAQVVTPFEVTATFKAGEPVGAVVVRDEMGRHEVRVAPAGG